MATKTLSMLLQITTKCSIQNTKSSNACNSRNKQKQIFNKQCAVELHCKNYTAHCTAKCKEMLHYKSIVHTQKHIYAATNAKIGHIFRHRISMLT